MRFSGARGPAQSCRSVQEPEFQRPAGGAGRGRGGPAARGLPSPAAVPPAPSPRRRQQPRPARRVRGRGASSQPQVSAKDSSVSPERQVWIVNLPQVASSFSLEMTAKTISKLDATAPCANSTQRKNTEGKRQNLWTEQKGCESQNSAHNIAELIGVWVVRPSALCAKGYLPIVCCFQVGVLFAESGAFLAVPALRARQVDVASDGHA